MTHGHGKVKAKIRAASREQGTANLWKKSSGNSRSATSEPSPPHGPHPPVRPCQHHLALRFLASRLVRKRSFVVSRPVCSRLLQQFSEPDAHVHMLTFFPSLYSRGSVSTACGTSHLNQSAQHHDTHTVVLSQSEDPALHASCFKFCNRGVSRRMSTELRIRNSQAEIDAPAHQTWHSVSKPLIPAEVTE